MNTSFFGELLQTISERGRALVERTRERRGSAAQSDGLIEQCEALLSGRGEASGVARAAEILAEYATLTTGPRIAFFEALASRFGVDRKRLSAAVTAWQSAPSDAAASKVHRASEPRRLELFRRLNLAPGGTAALVRMREQLMDAMDHRDDLAVIDDDFLHLFSSWFNRGFLVLRSIDWSTPANLLEKIIRYEAVHTIRDWNDLRARVDSPDRRCYAFFHPALADEPLIFVEVALTRGIPAAIEPILSAKREPVEPERATTAVFYSISNCQRGLAGVSFGHFLIKQVVEEVSREILRLATFITLSPAPNFAEWLKRERAKAESIALNAEDRAALAVLDRPDWWRDEATAEMVREPLLRAAAWYYLRVHGARGTPLDSVARFHLGNGARLERLNFLADTSERALQQSYGLMVNYLYDLEHIEQNHEAYAQQHAIVASGAVTRLVRAPTRDVAPAAE
ncbi:MAG: MCD, Malonyl-CoA decarboxylase MCD [Alphaproteobacteria bacterium]|nr:MAG: MCD, Malonyl-CoA decarboxylase MCD [Alphaproteobacteria bacterium]